MTKNQIDYWTFKELERANQMKEAETKRSNQAQEREKERSNRANEAISLYDVAEKQRHDTEQENYNLMSLEEQARHNTVNEGEAFRHDKATEGIQYYSAGAQNLSASANMAAVSESVRHDIALEELQDFKNTTEFMNVQNQFEIQSYANAIKDRAQKEEARANLVNEAERERANKMQEKIQRMKLITEGVTGTLNAFGSVSRGLAAAGLF